MEIICVAENRNLIVKISGELDQHTAESVRLRVDKEFLRMNTKNIIFDFGDVTFMDSSGIGMLIGRYKSAEKLGGQIFVVNIKNDINRIFSISGLSRLIRRCDTITDAIRETKA